MGAAERGLDWTHAWVTFDQWSTMKPGFYTVELVSIRFLSSYLLKATDVKEMVLMQMIR